MINKRSNKVNLSTIVHEEKSSVLGNRLLKSYPVISGLVLIKLFLNNDFYFDHLLTQLMYGVIMLNLEYVFTFNKPTFTRNAHNKLTLFTL